MVWWAIVLFGLLLFATRSKLGAKIFAFVVVLFAIRLIFIAFESEPRDLFFERNPEIYIYSRTVTEESIGGMPWYGEDEENFYIFYPAVYFFYPKSEVEKCDSFNQKDEQTWCTDNPFKIVTCYNEDKKTCYGII